MSFLFLNTGRTKNKRGKQDVLAMGWQFRAVPINKRHCLFGSFLFYILLLCNTNTSPSTEVRKVSFFYRSMVKIGKIACFQILTE